MTTPSSYTFTAQAYTVPLLHAAKYLASTTNGLFLGRITDSSITIEDAVPLLHNHISLTPMMEIGMDMANTYAQERGLRIVGYYQANKGEETGLGRVGERILGMLHTKWNGAFGMVVSSLKTLIPSVKLCERLLQLRTGNERKGVQLMLSQVDNAKLASREPPYIVGQSSANAELSIHQQRISAENMQIYLPSMTQSPMKPLSSSTSTLPEPFHLPASPASLASNVVRWIREERIYQNLGDFDDHLEDL